MNTLHGNLKVIDDDSVTRIDDLPVDYNRRICIEKVIKAADGAVAFDVSDIGTMVAFQLHTTGLITLNNGADIAVTSDLLLLNAAFSKTFTIANPGVANVTVSLRAYGVVA